MRARRLLLTTLGIAVLPVLLSGCIIVTAPRTIETSVPSGADGQTAPPSAPIAPGPPTSSTGAAPPATPTDAVECGEGGSPTVEGNEKTFRVTGTCAELTVVGTGLTVDAASSTIGTLRITGDRISTRFAEADAVVVEGDDAALTSEAGIGRLEIDGDRSVTEARTGIPSVAVRGRDNTVRSGGGVGSAVVTGSGNSIR